MSHCAVIYLKQHIFWGDGLREYIFFRAGTPPYFQTALINYIWHFTLWNSSQETNQISQELPTKPALTSRYQEEVAVGWCHVQRKIYTIWQHMKLYEKEMNVFSEPIRRIHSRAEWSKGLYLHTKRLSFMFTTFTSTRRVIAQMTAPCDVINIWTGFMFPLLPSNRWKQNVLSMKLK